MAMITCPTCEGRKVTGAFVSGTDEHGKRFSGTAMLDCVFCDGLGEVSGAKASWIARGKIIRSERFARGLNLQQAADAHRMTVTAYSRLARGQDDNTGIPCSTEEG